MPSFLDPWRSTLFSASGAAEIGLGLLSISAKWRKQAFFGQLLLLVALTPFVVYMLIDDPAIVDLVGTKMPLPLARLVLVFHNILLFLWIHWAYEQASRSEGAGLTPTARVLTSWTQSPVLTVAVVMLAANIAGFSAIAASPWNQALGHIWAMGCLASGALIGFVFGVPKWVGLKIGSPRERYQPNANIEKLSDWLTKIVVGVGLVELHELGPALGRMSDVFAKGAALRPGRTSSFEEAHAFANGIIVYFVAAGVIQGFLLTRMFLTRAWQTDEHSKST